MVIPGTATLLLTCSASATTPGGWRVQAAVPQSSAAIRSVVLANDPYGGVFQVTGDARATVGPLTLDAQLPWVHTWAHDGLWEPRSFPGQLRVGAHGWLHHQHFQLGLEVAFPVSSAPGTGTSWGSLSSETLPAWEIAHAFHTTWATERFSVTARAVTGVRWGRFQTGCYGSGDIGWCPVFDFAYGLTRHIVGPLGFAMDLELVSDRVPVTARPMLRLDIPARRGWLVLDAGLQFPPLTTVEDWVAFSHFPLQPIAQARWYPVLDWPWPGVHFDSEPRRDSPGREDP